MNEKTLLTELHKYCYYDATIPYTRNLIATDNENYTLLLLCWNQNQDQRSPIHNHPGDGCYMRVLSGSIIEQLYNVVPSLPSLPQTESTVVQDDTSSSTTTTTVTLECIATHHYTTNQVTFINDTIGYHSIGCGPSPPPPPLHTQSNHTSSPLRSVPGAISLHLYCPPIRQCQIVVTSSSSSSLSYNDCGSTSNIYVRDSGPMYHHTEYGCRTS